MRRYGQAVSYPASAPSELPRSFHALFGVSPRKKIQLQGHFGCVGAQAGLEDRHEPLKVFGKASEVPHGVLPTHRALSFRNAGTEVRRMCLMTANSPFPGLGPPCSDKSSRAGHLLKHVRVHWDVQESRHTTATPVEQGATRRRRPNPGKCESRAMRGRCMRRRAERGPYTTKKQDQALFGCDEKQPRTNHLHHTVLPWKNLSPGLKLCEAFYQGIKGLAVFRFVGVVPCGLDLLSYSGCVAPGGGGGGRLRPNRSTGDRSCVARPRVMRILVIEEAARTMVITGGPR